MTALTPIFRPWKMDDKPFLLKYANNKKIADNMRDRFPHPYTEEAAERFISRVASAEPCNVFAIEVNDEVVGSVCIFPKEDIERLNAEVGYWIAEEFWGKGLATLALGYIIDYGFKTFSLNRIFAVAFPHNHASKRIIEKNGMVLEATIKDCIIKNGIIMDECIYAIRRNVREAGWDV